MATGRTTNPRKAAARAAAPLTGDAAGAHVIRATPEQMSQVAVVPAWAQPGPGRWDPATEVVLCCGRSYRSAQGYGKHLERAHTHGPFGTIPEG